jgi:hypothetical protein
MFKKFLPFVFVLMYRKDEESYKKVFEFLKINLKFNLKIVIIDFKLALKNSLLHMFGAVNVFGCNFHFAQSLWRKFKKLRTLS